MILPTPTAARARAMLTWSWRSSNCWQPAGRAFWRSWAGRLNRRRGTRRKTKNKGRAKLARPCTACVPRGGLPALDVLAPIVIVSQVPAKKIVGRGGGLGRPAAQVHVGFGGRPTALAPVALLAGGHQVVPAMLAAAVARLHVIDGQVRHLPSAILAGVVVATKNLALGQLHPRPRAPDHACQPDDRRARDAEPR